MSIHFGYITASTTLYIPFESFENGASITLTGLAVTDIEIYKNGSTTQRSSDAGYALLDTDGIDFDGITGIHGFSIDLSDNTDAGFYAAGSQYWVIVSSVTVSGETVSFIAATFSIGPADANVTQWLGTAAATPTVAGVPEVDVTHMAGGTQTVTDLKDFADAGYDPGTNKVQGVVLVDTTTTNSDMVAAAPTAATNAGAVWNSTRANFTGAGSFGQLVSTSTAAPDIFAGVSTGTAFDSVTSVTNAVTISTASIIQEVSSVTDGSTLVAADVNAEVDTALIDINLDHLLAVAGSSLTIVDDSFIAQMVSGASTPTWASFASTTDSLEALRNRGDAAYTTLSTVGIETLSTVGIETLSTLGIETLSTAGIETLSTVGIETASSLVDMVNMTTAAAIQVNAEVDAAIETYRLDHLLLVAGSTLDVTDQSLWADLVSINSSYFSFNSTTDSLQALRDRGDAAYTTLSTVGLETLSTVGIETLSTVGIETATGFSTLGSTQIQDAVWNSTRASHVIAGTFGELVSTSTAAPDQFVSAALTGSTDVNVVEWRGILPSTLGPNSHIRVSTTTLISTAQTLATVASVTGNVIGSVGSVASATGIALAVWGATRSAYVAAGSFGQMVSTSTTAPDQFVKISTLGLETLSTVGIETLSTVGIETLSTVGIETLSTVGLETLSTVGLETASSVVTVAGLTTAAALEVNAEVLDVLNTDTFGAPTGAPGATVTLTTKVGFLYSALRHGLRVGSSGKTFLDASSAVQWVKGIGGDTSTYFEVLASTST